MNMFRNDATQVAMRSMDLEALDNTLYEPKYAELKARSVLSLKTDIPAGAETYAYDVMTRSGVAKILANDSDDVPLVDIDKRRETSRIYSIVTGYRVNVQELRAAQMTNYPVDTAKAGVARRAVAEKENRLVWIGDPDYNIKGLVNMTGIQTTSVAAGAKGSTKWSQKTGAEIVEDVRKTRSLVTVLPSMADTPLTLALPAAAYEEAGKRYSDYDNRTVLDVIRSYGWFESIVSVPDLAGQGTAASDCMLIFDASAENMQLVLPMDLMRHEPEWKFPNWKVAVEERCGGALVRYPMTIARGDGI